jgi:hypothetical protein
VTEREGRETRAAKENESEKGEGKREKEKPKRADQPTLELTPSPP